MKPTASELGNRDALLRLLDLNGSDEVTGSVSPPLSFALPDGTDGRELDGWQLDGVSRSARGNSAPGQVLRASPAHA